MPEWAQVTLLISSLQWHRRCLILHNHVHRRARAAGRWTLLPGSVLLPAVAG